MASSVTVARYILQLADKDKRPVTPLELNKLTYIAQGWSLAKRDQSLVDEPAEAWQYGPVYRGLYYILKRFGGYPVIRILDFTDEDRIALDDEEKALIRAVYEAYKHLSGLSLSRLTHQDGSPWDKAWHRYGQNSRIDNESIKDHYQQLDKDTKRQKQLL